MRIQRKEELGTTQTLRQIMHSEVQVFGTQTSHVDLKSNNEDMRVSPCSHFFSIS